MVTRLAELARFGSVGVVAFVVDAGLFNLLRFGPGTVLGDRPLTAKAVSVVVATVVAWVGHRSWTFAARRRPARGRALLRELAAFSAVSAGGMGIALVCLAVSHYALGLTSPLADNVSANGVGLALGTAFRYLAYRRLVFNGAVPATGTPVPAPALGDDPALGEDPAPQDAGGEASPDGAPVGHLGGSPPR